MTPNPLDIVERRSVEADVALTERNAAIKAAHEAGCSLRDIAEAAGVSHQTVKNILNREGVTVTKYAIMFSDGDMRLYAGTFRGAAGFAPTITTADLYDSKEAATKAFVLGYGSHMRKIGKVVEV